MIIDKKRLVVSIVVASLCSFTLLSCTHKPPAREIIDPTTKGLNSEVKAVLTSGKPAVIVMGTGLCDNCKMVADIVNILKEKRKDLEIGWLVYEDYRDQATFKAFHLTISPTTYLINQDREVKRRITGTYSEEDLLNALKEEGIIH